MDAKAHLQVLPTDGPGVDSPSAPSPKRPPASPLPATKEMQHFAVSAIGMRSKSFVSAQPMRKVGCRGALRMLVCACNHATACRKMP